MNSKDNPLTEYDADFLKSCMDAVGNHPHDGPIETAYNLSLMFHYAILRLSDNYKHGRDAGLLMMACVIDETKQEAIRQIKAEDMEDEDETQH